jgi:hypothetical protein
MNLEYTEITTQDLIRFALKERSIALPEFQRPFEWDENDVADMMRTVINDWPAGTVLLLGQSDLISKLEVSELRGAPPIGPGEKAGVRMLVLDGQQRLTSLFQTLTDNAEKFIYYVDMKSVHERDRFEDDCLSWVKREDYPDEQEAANSLWAALHVLYSEKRFEDWLDRVDPKLRDRMEALFDEHLWPIRAYKFPANTLPADLELRSLVRIFDKLNRLGEELKTFDLLVALMLPEGFKLRQRAEEAQKTFAGIGNGNGFSVNGIEMTKLIALEEHLRQVAVRATDESADVVVGGIREDDVLDLVDYNAALISEDWDDAVERYANALRFLQMRCGAVTPNLLPQGAMTLALSVGLSASDPRSAFEDDLEKWVWCTYFTQAYAQGVNTRAVSDANELLTWARDADKKPTAVRVLETQPELVGERLRDSRKGNAVFVRGIAALLIADGAKDWLKPKKEGEPQELALHDGAIDFHHVFPDKYLTDRGKPSEMVVNFTPLKASTNRSLGRDAPSTVFGNDRFDPDALVKHRIDRSSLQGDKVDDYVELRIAALRSLIATETDITAIDPKE